MALDAVKDKTLKGLDNKAKVILVLAMYKAQAQCYDAELDSMRDKGLLTFQERRQILVRTVRVDREEGYSADIVFVDFTRTSSPGFTADLQRLRVSLGCARDAEVIVMSRGIFVGYNKPAEKMPPGQNVLHLARVYQNAASAGGIVTKKITATDSTGATDAETHVQMQCQNCLQKGHDQKECAEPLKCENCEKLGHSSHYCPRPHARCGICRKTDHHQADCPCCPICGNTGHQKYFCPARKWCLECGETGHHEPACPTLRITDEISYSPKRFILAPRAMWQPRTKATATEPSARDLMIARANALIDPRRRAKPFGRRSQPGNTAGADPGTGGSNNDSGVATAEDGWDSGVGTGEDGGGDIDTSDW
jgi:hypothetical protein